MNKIILILLVLLAHISFAQVKLNEKFTNRKVDSTLVKELIMYTQEEKDSATQLLHEVYGLTISNECNYSAGITFFNYRLALKAANSNYFTKAEQYLLNASKNLKDEAILESINAEFIKCYEALGQYNKSIELIFNQYQNVKSDQKKSELYQKLKGYYQDNKFDSVQINKFFNLSIDRKDELFIVKNLFQFGQKDSALYYLNQLLDSANTQADIAAKLQAKIFYARYYRESKDVKKATALILPVISVLDSLKNYALLSEALTEYGKICFAQKQVPASLAAFSKALSYLKLANNNEQLSAHLSFLVNFYNAIGKPNLAKLYNDTLLQVMPPDGNVNSISNTNQQQLQFDSAIQKCYEILIKKPNEKNETFFTINVLFALVGLAIILLIVLVFIYLKKQPKIIKEEVVIEKELPAKEIIKEVVVEVTNNKPSEKLNTLYKSLDLNTSTLSKVLRGSFISETANAYHVFCWMADLRLSRTAPQRGLFFAFADNVLKGEDAAFYNIQLNEYLNKIVKEKNILQPSAILNHLNRAIVEFNSNKNQNWKTKLVFCFINADSTELLFAGASLNIKIIRNAKVYDIKADAAILGDVGSDFQFQDNSVGIAKGDLIVITDCVEADFKQKINALIIEGATDSITINEKLQNLLNDTNYRVCMMVV